MRESAVHKSFHPRRELGRTGFVATLLGIGDLADRSVPIEQCVATARRAMDYGLNVIDTAPGYEDGYSEQIVGRAVKGRRDGLFVIDKIDHHDRPVGPQIDQSLGRLGLDAVDLFVFHGLSKLDSFRTMTAEGGAFDQLDAAIAAGKARFAGISSHDPDTLLAAIDSGRFAVLMFPVGPYVDERYVTQVLPQAKSAGIGTVCFKSFGAGKLLGDTAGYGRPLADRPRGKLSSGGQDTATPTLPHMGVSECLQYTLTCDPDVALLGMSFANEVDAAIAAALDFRPLTDEQAAATRARAQTAIQDKGPCWWNP